ncbi:MAG: AAA family ATPase [DPANN group archaeon]|nr:AAA family ATPase [DPANN group archaeon]
MRVPTGIQGLDELIEGGLLEGSSTLIAGGTGTGKTIFGSQYIYNGAKDYSEPGIYITFEEGEKNLWWNMKNFRWDVAKYTEQNMMKIYKVSMIEPGEFAARFNSEIERIKDMVDKMNAKRLVIDSTTSFGMWMESDHEIRYSLFKLAEELKEMNVTTLLTAETLGGKSQLSRFGVEEFITDGVISLYYRPPRRFMMVRKMRGTDHNKDIHPYDITSHGLEINTQERVLWESLVD